MLAGWLDLPPWAIAATLVAFYGLSAALLHLASFRWPTRRHLAGLQGMVTPFFVTSNTLFALTVAFLGASAWDTYRGAVQAVLHEREGVVAALELANAVPPEAERLREEIEAKQPGRTKLRSRLLARKAQMEREHASPGS